MSKSHKPIGDDAWRERLQNYAKTHVWPSNLYRRPAETKNPRWFSELKKVNISSRRPLDNHYWANLLHCILISTFRLSVWSRLRAHPCFSMTPTFNFFLEKLVSYQEKDGRSQARPSFFWYDNDSEHKRPFRIYLSQPI